MRRTLLLAGALIAFAGIELTYAIDAATFVVSLGLVVALVPPAEVPVEEAAGAALARGLELLRVDPVLRPVTEAQFLSSGWPRWPGGCRRRRCGCSSPRRRRPWRSRRSGCRAWAMASGCRR